MGVILQLLLIKAIVYGVGIQQRHTQCVCFNSERSPLGMGKDMRNGRGLCLPLMINKGTLASAANEAVCTTWKVLRGRGRDDAAPRLCHTACPWHLYCVPAVHPASSSVWRVTTLILLILCMGMVVGLVALGIMSVTQQNYLQAEKESLSGTLQQLAKKFCQDLIKQSEKKGSFSKYGLVTSSSPLSQKYFCAAICKGSWDLRETLTMAEKQAWFRMKGVLSLVSLKTINAAHVTQTGDIMETVAMDSSGTTWHGKRVSSTVPTWMLLCWRSPARTFWNTSKTGLH